MDHGKKSTCYFLGLFHSVDFAAFLMASIYRPQDLYIIHCDRKSPGAILHYAAEIAERYDNIVLMESRNYSWAGYSQVQTTLEALAIADATQHDWSHFVCLSEQHLPLLTPGEIAARLPADKSMVAMRKAADFTGPSRTDVLTRFLVKYDELAGCGCFGTDLNEQQGLLDGVYHGSNWFILARKHARALVQAERSGLFAPFKHAVHADENAIQTVLHARVDAEELINEENVLISLPHLTDNNSLVMTDELFFKASREDYLFIRKRQKTLSAEVERYIKANNFVEDFCVAATSARQNKQTSRVILRSADVFAQLSAAMPQQSMRLLDPEQFNFVPKFYTAIESASNPARSVCVISENMTDFKVCLVDTSRKFNGFLLPFVEDDRLFCTLRVRLFALAFQTEIVSLSDPSRGRVTLDGLSQVDKLAETVSRYVDLGSRVTLPARVLDS